MFDAYSHRIYVVKPAEQTLTKVDLYKTTWAGSIGHIPMPPASQLCCISVINATTVAAQSFELKKIAVRGARTRKVSSCVRHGGLIDHNSQKNRKRKKNCVGCQRLEWLLETCRRALNVGEIYRRQDSNLRPMMKLVAEGMAFWQRPLTPKGIDF